MSGPWEKYAAPADGPWRKYAPAAQDEPKPEPAPKAGTLANIGMGALKGAASIGTTLLTPVDYLLNKTGVTDTTNADRRASLNDFFTERSDPNSIAFKAGEIGAGIAGTAGVGGALGKGVMAAGRALPALAPYAPTIATALQTGGFRTTPAGFVGPSMAPTLASKAADMGLRTIAGGIVGGTSAGLIDPEQAKTGAMIGAAIPGGVKVAGMIGDGIKSAAGAVSKNALGVSTGAGANAIEGAYQAGKAGNTAFLDNMRGAVPMADVLDSAKTALNNMRMARGNEYRQGMAGVSADKSVLDMNPVMDAVKTMRQMGNYKGQVINKNAAKTVDEISQQVEQWAQLNPAEFHTPEGLDALKKAVGDIRDATQFGTPARRAADSVYNTIKDQITRQAPTYSKVMGKYSEASDLIGEIERALSLNPKASVDTAMRKLQSLMRNNVNTNYGNRLNLAKDLEQQGGASLLPSLAGQALSSPIPRGLQAAVASGTGMGGLAGMIDPFTAIPALAMQSPRLVGEAAYGLGKMAGGVGNTTQGLLSGPVASELLKQQPYLPLMTVIPSVAMSR